MITDLMTEKSFVPKKTYEKYAEYICGNVSFEDLLEDFVNQAHIIIHTNFSGVNDFDKEDLICVSISKIANIILQDKSKLFYAEVKDTNEYKMSVFSYRVMINCMRDYFRKFNLSACPPEPYYGFAPSDRLDLTPDIILCKKELHDEVSKKIVDFVIDNCRFDISTIVIKYFVLSKLGESSDIKYNKVTPNVLNTLFKIQDPDVTLDRLTFLYRWAMSEMKVDVCYVNSEIERLSIDSESMEDML